MISARVIIVLIALALWAIRLRRRFSPAGARGFTKDRLFDAGCGIVVFAIVWWEYVQATDPTIHELSDLLNTHLVDVGGGSLPTGRFVVFLLIGLGLATLFVLAGHFICRKTAFLGIADFHAADAGIFYYVGIAAFLTLFASLGIVSGHAFASLVSALIVFVAAGVYTLTSQRVVPRCVRWLRESGVALALLSPVVLAILCLLHYVATRRGGPVYEDIARFVVTENRIPLVNRHFGQSLLASIQMFFVGTGPDCCAYPRAFVNNWLYLSQIAMLFLLHRFLSFLGVSRFGSVVGVVILMLGNAALSLLPHIIYDHDYPLIMDVYADSLFGLGGWLILVMYWVDCARDIPDDDRNDTPSAGNWWWTLLVPASIVMAFNYTAELNIVIVFITLAALVTVSQLKRIASLRIARLSLTALMAMTLVLGCAALAGAFEGGVFAGKLASASRKASSPFWEQDASSATMSITDAKWWYLPYLVPGFDNGFGNLPVPVFVLAGSNADPAIEATRAMSESTNGKFLDRVGTDKSGTAFKYINVLYLIEMRLFDTLRVIWFPVLGLVGLGGLLAIVPRTPPRKVDGSEREWLTLRLFWFIAAASFLAGLSVVFLTNSVNGSALFWKWALTRFLEPGLCLGMVAFVVVLDRLLRLVRTSLQRVAWIVLSALMSFGTLFRILFYPTFNG
jgi:hypothetical protein